MRKILILLIALIILIGWMVFTHLQQIPPKETHPQNCMANNDCPRNARCMVIGPLIAGQPVKKVCVKEGQVAPL